jgi:hypothetical protein
VSCLITFIKSASEPRSLAKNTSTGGGTREGAEILIQAAWADGTARVVTKGFGRFTQGALTAPVDIPKNSGKRLEAFSTLETFVSRGKLCRESNVLERLKTRRSFYVTWIVDFVAQTVAE